ncbi:MAG: extracellular solute-binding protein [Alcanivoracaceae bacterium]|nr:extracellular solute-binding protein [Alcanivoracaceae bacterium]
MHLSRWTLGRAGAIALLLANAAVCAAAPQHGYHPFGVLKYPADFHHFDYVNPNAPKGGTLKLLGSGDFDSINPYILAGRSPANTPGAYVFGFLEMTDTLLMGADAHNSVGDEAGAAYGLIAKSIDCDAQLDQCTFQLRREARFQDGTPITADDVLFSFNLLRDHGHPRYALRYQQIDKVSVINSHQVRFHFTGDNRRMLPLTAGQLPVLAKHYWQDKDFSKPTLTPPVISAPYRVASVQPGRQITLQRDANYWGRDLPVNRGRYNFDQVVIDFYRDAEVAFEAFKTGRYDVHLDYIAKHWATAYDFPAVRDGRVKRAEIPHRIAQGTQAFFFNQRRAPFDNPDIRQALGLLFDYEWTNRNIFNGAYQRQLSWFPNSEHSTSGLPAGAELALLEPFRQQLPEKLFSEPFALPVSDGSGRDRRHMQQAMALFNKAGYLIRDKKLVHDETGKALSLEILNYHNPGMDRVIQPWLRNLEALGVEASYRSIDPASFKQRLDQFDFDVALFVLPQNTFPGVELIEYLHSSSADMNGGRNYAGIQDPVIDALIGKALSASTLVDYRAALRALDRVLLWRHYTIPHWYLGRHRLAWWDRFEQPGSAMPYILGTETWWMTEAERTQ